VSFKKEDALLGVGIVVHYSYLSVALPVILCTPQYGTCIGVGSLVVHNEYTTM
jgi:hypothetical protein